MDELNANKIEQGLGAKRLARSVLCFEEVGSTNDIAWDSLRQADTDGLVILAESQRQGRGRQGRSWISPPRKNILMSVLLREEMDAMSPEAVTIAAGLAVAEAIEHETHLSAEIKWPNDVLLSGAKVAGVLVERRVASARAAMVIGLGVNVGAAPPTGQIEQPATCLRDAVGAPVKRTPLVRAILRRLDAWLETIRADNLPSLHDAWIAHCGMLNERVSALTDGREHTGRVVDVSPLLGLELIDDHGLRLHLPATSTTIVHRMT